jgi:hypothetical protein
LSALFGASSERALERPSDRIYLVETCPMRLLIEFDGFQKEQELIGRMIMAYGEFEFEIAHLMDYVDLGKDMAPRILFRVNGEAARLAVADAILRPYFERMNLGGQWSNALGALRFCKNIRNQYAHCNWTADPGKPLCFINVDRDADSPDESLTLHLYPTDLSLIQEQHQYFEYTLDWLHYLNCQCRRQRGEDAPQRKVPKSVPQPLLHNLPKKRPPPPEVCTTPKEQSGQS